MAKRIIKTLFLLFVVALLAYSVVDVAMERFALPFGETIPQLQPDTVFPNYEHRFYLRQLRDESLQVACVLYNAMITHETVCTIPRGLYVSQVSDLISILQAECPELFHVDFHKGLSFYYYSGSNEVYRIEIPYKYTKEVYASMRAACETEISRLTEALHDKSPYEKEKILFDRLALSCMYDDSAEHCGNPYGALVEGNAKCDGIALAFKWCLEFLDMDALCIFADPIHGTVGHAWNMVSVDGMFCNVDLTASMRYSDMDAFSAKRVIYPYFNVSDIWFTEDYQILPAFDAFAQRPRCMTDMFSFYAQQDQYVGGNVDLKALTEQLFDRAAQQGESWLYFENTETFTSFNALFQTNAQNWMNANASTILSVEWYTMQNNLFCVVVNKRD